MFFHRDFHVQKGECVCVWIHKEISGFIKFILRALRNNFRVSGDEVEQQ